jgi:molybdopterin synthase catalytic subunit
MSSEKKHKTVFINGPITPAFIADSLTKHAAKHDIGAHSMFMGQVRADVIDKQIVSAIDYEAYELLANEIRTKCLLHRSTQKRQKNFRHCHLGMKLRHLHLHSATTTQCWYHSQMPLWVL